MYFVRFSPTTARSKCKGELKHQAVQGKDTVQSIPNSEQKKIKVFDKMELAALDTIYKASKGLPTNSMIERLTSSLDLEKDQVISIKNSNMYLSVFIVLRCFHCQASNQLSHVSRFP